MFKLPEVTLVMIETREHELAALAVRDSVAKIDFGEVLIFTDQPHQFVGLGARVVLVPDWPSKLGWCQFHMHGVSPYLRTAFALGIQWDSWITDTHQWTDEFLRYDYIGGPWNYKDGMNVGDGGFELRSTALLRYLRKHQARFPCTNERDDELVCRTYRNALMDDGFEWAPEALARRFSAPVGRDLSQRMFGFHSLAGFWYGCKGDQEKFLERVRILARSKHLSGALWTDFVDKNPEVQEELLKCTA
jgi:Protein of unknown function (DUF5672)